MPLDPIRENEVNILKHLMNAKHAADLIDIELEFAPERTGNIRTLERDLANLHNIIANMMEVVR